MLCTNLRWKVTSCGSQINFVAPFIQCCCNLARKTSNPRPNMFHANNKANDDSYNWSLESTGLSVLGPIYQGRKWVIPEKAQQYLPIRHNRLNMKKIQSISVLYFLCHWRESMGSRLLAQAQDKRLKKLVFFQSLSSLAHRCSPHISKVEQRKKPKMTPHLHKTPVLDLKGKHLIMS